MKLPAHVKDHSCTTFFGASVADQSRIESGKAPGDIMVGGVRSIRATRAELAEVMVSDVFAARSGLLPLPKLVVASNGAVIAQYHKDAAFKALIDAADIVDVDGMPSVFATRLFCKVPLSERIATTDFILDACDAAASNGVRFYMLGGKDGVAHSR